MIRTQGRRQISISTPLDRDALLVKRLEATEALSRPFEFRLDLLSDDANIDFDRILAQSVTVRLEAMGEARCYNGIVSEFEHVAVEEGISRYRAVVVPWVWFLTRTADCQIFQDMSVPDIIKAVFREHGFSDFQDELTGSYTPREYCVQYRETAFNFVSRLMEEEGIYYYFRHDMGSHSLVLTDASSAHDPVEGYETIEYHAPDDVLVDREHITSWSTRHRVESGLFAHTDFDFANPNAGLETRSRNGAHEAMAGFEVFDFPGNYTESAEGEQYARIRIEQLHRDQATSRGAGDTRGLRPGFVFTLANYPRDDQNRDYLVLSTTTEYVSDAFSSSDASTEAGTFRCSFDVIPADTQYRPLRTSEQPTIQGPQTAFVVGKAGEEIWTDEYGRVKVQFHWDRYSTADEKSSCWIRVAQNWAGKKWGSMYIPRIGHEVIVEFLEGNPDRPIITGRVYNGRAKPPYDLPANATMSGIKTLSSKGGNGFNELRFEDKKGEEQVFIHAEKNFDLRVKNDRYEVVQNDQHVIVENDHLFETKNARHETVGADSLEEIGADFHFSVGGMEAKEVGSSKSLTVGGDVLESFGGSHEEETSGSYKLKASDITIEGMSKITLKVGGSSIEISAGGVTIKAPSVTAQTPSFTATANATISANATVGANLTVGAGATVGANVMAGGQIMGTSVITTSVVSASYTPGAGNIM